MKRASLILILIVISSCGYSQFPVGKPTSIAEKEIRQFLKSKGFTFYKKSVNDKNIELAYSEEFTVMLSTDGFGNIYHLNYATTKMKVYDRLLTILDYKNWQLISKNPVSWSPSDIEYHYQYKDFYILDVYLGVHNIKVTLIE